MYCRITYRLLVIASISITLLFASCNSFDEPSLNYVPDTAATMSIAELGEMVGDYPLNIDRPVTIKGCVVSSDIASNFHKTFVINDDSGGVEIMAGIYDLANIYPEGQTLVVSLDGCSVARRYGVLQVGLESESYSGFDVEYFASRVLLDEHVARVDENSRVEPLCIAIDAMSPELCGRLVCVKSLEMVTEEYLDGWQINQEGKWSGYNIFRDVAGCNIGIYTSEYANYSDRRVPSGEVDIVGVLQYGTVAGEDMYMLKMRYEEDCQSTI